MNRIKIPLELKKMNEIFSANGFEAYLVGGAVRDMLLGKPASDWDVTTDARPEDVLRIFHRVIPTGIAHGTVTVHFMKKEIEVTTYRTEEGYSDGRHPDKVSFDASLEDDLSRRDFTMNAIAASLADGSIVDPFDGRKDIKDKLIRTVGKARDRFLEDGLRPIRAIRFSSQLNFVIQKDTYSAILESEVQEKIHSISLERFRDEFCKMLKSPQPSAGLHRMEECGILAYFIPELAAGRGLVQADCRGFHEFDVLDHNLYACDGAPEDNLIVRLAALFHDVGKTYTRTVEHKLIDGVDFELFHFHGHETKSEEIARKVLFRLKFSNAQTDEVCHLIKNHMFFFEPAWTDAAVRRFVVRIGLENMENLFLLRYADIYGMHRTALSSRSETVHNLNELKDRIARVEAEKSARSLKDLAVNGKDLMNIGIPAGKQLGRILNELFQCVLDDPAMNERKKLLLVAGNLAKKC